MLLYCLVLPGLLLIIRTLRIKWDGYGYIIEGFNVKCVGKVPYTITFYSPQGYLYGDEKGELKEGDTEYDQVYNRPTHAVWREQYYSQALFSDDTRLWQNTKNLAKPRHRAILPYRNPRGCLPVPPVNLKDPLKYDDIDVKLKTHLVASEIGDTALNKECLPWYNYYATYRIENAYWNIPDKKSSLVEIQNKGDKIEWIN